MEFLDQDSRIPPALVVLLPAGRRKVIQGTLDEAAFGLEILTLSGCRRERSADEGMGTITEFILDC